VLNNFRIYGNLVYIKQPNFAELDLKESMLRMLLRLLKKFTLMRNY